MSRFSIAIHGGAGALSNVSVYKESIEQILRSAAQQAEGGHSALDVVEFAVRELENDPLFNAGKGSVLNARGQVELDAAVMDGRTLDAGSVAAVHNIKNPISLARLVMEKSPHVMLIGEGAMDFAREQDVAHEEDEYFITSQRQKQLEDAQRAGEQILDHSDPQEKKMGTVGAVAIDAHGNLAAATSTGGIVNKQYGRVGDSPIVGSGVFAENGLCAVSATGYGEQFIRTTLSKHIGDWMRYNDVDAQKAADEGIRFLVEKVDGIGGVIVVDAQYRVGFAHSTPLILGGSISEKGDVTLFF